MVVGRYDHPVGNVGASPAAMEDGSEYLQITFGRDSIPSEHLDNRVADGKTYLFETNLTSFRRSLSTIHTTREQRMHDQDRVLQAIPPQTRTSRPSRSSSGRSPTHRNLLLRPEANPASTQFFFITTNPVLIPTAKHTSLLT